jgi:P-type Cu+ transporter
MAEPERGAGDPRPVAGPVAKPVGCAHCGQPVDPLRAARVAVFYDRFRYFCTADCREHYDPEARHSPIPQARRRSGDASAVTSAQIIATRTSSDDAELEARRRAARALAVVGGDGLGELGRGDAPEVVGADELAEPALPGAASARTLRHEPGASEDLGSLLLTLAMVGGVLGFALALAGSSRVALTSRLVVVVVATGALLAYFVTGRRDPSEPHPLAVLAAPCAAVLACVVAWLVAHPRTDSTLTLAGLIVAVVAAGAWFMQRLRRPVEAEREQIVAELDQAAQRVVGEEVTSVRAADLRPGEEIVIGPAETVAADAIVTAGAASVQLWPRAPVIADRAEGDAVVAGARVIQGRLRAVVGWAGYDRAWLKLTTDLRRRADLLASLARIGRLTAERGAPLAAALAALTAFAANQDLLGIVVLAIAAESAIATQAVAQVVALHVARTVLMALRRGIVFSSADALDATGRVSVAAFCARGTLLLGEPEVVNIEALAGQESERVLALVAGAEAGARDPVGTAVLRAARMRGVRPDAVRSPTQQAGLGVTAIAANGQPLVVGTRALMLRERISVAAAETKILDLEAMGRTVMLVALGGHLVGILAFQDGLRPGARAAVQHVLDAGVEPVLLSGDSRETCEALGRVLDIEHIRPEVLPADRGDEVRRLADGGANVAVIGQSPADDAALSAADVSVALASAGATNAEWHVHLVSDDVRDAAYAIRLAHRCHADSLLGLGLALGPGVLGAVAVAFGLVPPAIAPVAALVGLLATVYRLRARDEEGE